VPAIGMLAVLAGTAAARQYKNAGAPTDSQGVVVEVGDAAVSPANPLPAMLAPSVTGGIAPVASTAPSLVAKASPGNLYGYHATAGGSAAFVALLNATTVPAAGAAIAPLECSAVPANGTYRTRQDIPDRYTVGIVLLFTTSCSTYTAGAPALIGAVVQ
jgi:hypothetical protein